MRDGGQNAVVDAAPNTTFGYTDAQIDSIPGLRDDLNAAYGTRAYSPWLIENALSNPIQYSEGKLYQALLNGDQSKVAPNVQFLVGQGKDVSSIQTDLTVFAQQDAQNANNGAFGGGFLSQTLSAITNPTTLAMLSAAALIPGYAESAAPGIASALGVSTATGQAIATGTLNAAVQVASGVPASTAIENAGIATLAPTVGNAVSSASGIPSIIDSTLSDANLVSPSSAAVNKAIGTTVLNAGADVLSNKDPTQAVNAGVGSLVGSVAGANTGTDSNAVNNAVGSTVGAATTAGLNNTNVGTAVENSLISSALNSAGSSLKNTDTSGTTTPTTTPTTTGTTETTPTNTTPTTTGTTETTPTETTPTTTAGTTETTPANTTPTSTTPSIDATGVVDNSGMATFKGDGQPGDYPTQIITNNDGSVTTVENNGTSLTLNTDGSIVQSHEDGSTSNPLNTDLPPGVYPDGNGGFTDIFGNPVTATGQSLTYDSKGNLIDSNGNVYQYTPTIDNTPPTNTNTGGAGSIGGIGTIGGKGISGGKGGGSGGGGGGSGLGTAITGLGVIAANLLNKSSGTLQNTGLQSLTNTGSFDWNPNQIVGPENGVAYGQQILNPTYTKNAKEGGMVNHLASDGEITMNPITFKQGGDVHREIYNALKQSGHPVDGDTLSKIAHLNSMGAPSHHIVGFLNHQRMSSGGPLGAYSDGGHFLKGPGDGMSDDIPARIGGHQEARLANEEFVIPADVVSHLGNGSSEAGAKVLYKMMDKIRHARTGTTKQGKQINPDKFMPK